MSVLVVGKNYPLYVLAVRWVRVANCLFKQEIKRKIHCDLWGPAPVHSFQYMKYYVLFIDDCTRFIWSFPLLQKSNFFSVFIKSERMIENQFSTKIKIFQCDGGGEFQSKSSISHLEENGILQSISCPHTLEQNGIAEK